MLSEWTNTRKHPLGPWAFCRHIAVFWIMVFPAVQMVKVDGGRQIIPDDKESVGNNETKHTVLFFPRKEQQWGISTERGIFRSQLCITEKLFTENINQINIRFHTSSLMQHKIRKITIQCFIFTSGVSLKILTLKLQNVTASVHLFVTIIASVGLDSDFLIRNVTPAANLSLVVSFGHPVTYPRNLKSVLH